MSVLSGICEEIAFEKGPEFDNPQKEAGGEFKKEATEPMLSRKPGDVHRHWRVHLLIFDLDEITTIQQESLAADIHPHAPDIHPHALPLQTETSTHTPEIG